MTEKDYQKTLIRIWDSMRDNVFKGESCCTDISCSECPINFGCGSVMHYYEVVKFVEQWAKEHPIETNGSRFLKKYPKAVVYRCDSNDDGFIYLRLDYSKPFVVDGENSTKFPIAWWESEVDDAVNNQHS